MTLNRKTTFFGQVIRQIARMTPFLAHMTYNYADVPIGFYREFFFFASLNSSTLISLLTKKRYVNVFFPFPNNLLVRRMLPDAVERLQKRRSSTLTRTHRSGKESDRFILYDG